MFEGVIHRVVVGYLGRYVKDFHKDQLKLSLWNEEVFLENVDLIPEAFDYLQLPFSIKQGRVGKLSIKISWKKLGWDHPIIIILEDVFVCVSQRDDREWDLDAVEKREFAGKKAQLAAAELSKLSRRVCDNQAGKSFISYITAKVLDSIQVSIKNFHIQYDGVQFDTAQVLFGLKFSGLTVKQHLFGSFGGKPVGGQVNKTVDIEGLEIYCNTSEKEIDSISLNDETNSKLQCSSACEGNRLDHMLQPVNVSFSLMVNRAGKLDTELPHCYISAELSDLDLSLNDVQLQQILILLDYMNTCRLREKYGRFRPWDYPLSRKQDGWQKLWWHYAQESVLSDVRRKLTKTSWRYLGLRLSFRRKYIDLYKTKLVYLQKEQSIDEHILHQLEEMEKESSIDDILSYRSAAECKLQEALSISYSSNVGVNGANISSEKSVNDERSSGRSRGWLNWLSRGMLGAGGTDDSSQFSGVVSDEVVKDIYEATKFHPSVLSSGDADSNDKVFTCAIRFSIGRISATLQNKFSSQKVADFIFQGVVIECKLREELATIICTINSGEMYYPFHKKVILHMGKFLADNNEQDELFSCRVQVDVSRKQEIELSIGVALQPLELTCDVEFMQNLMEFFNVLSSFNFQTERVLLSLDGIKDVQSRMLSKAEYILSNRRRLSWEFNVTNVIINVPWGEAISEPCNLVVELGSFVYGSKWDVDPVAPNVEDQSYIMKQFSGLVSDNTFLTGLKVQDLYNLSVVKFEEFGLKIMTPQHAQSVSLLEKFGGSITLASCIISDESILKQLEVFVNLSSLRANFSPSIYLSIMSLIEHLGDRLSRSKPLISENHNDKQNRHASTFGFSLSTSLDFVSIHVDLSNAGDSSFLLIFSVQKLDIRYLHSAFHQCRVCAKSLKIFTSSLSNEYDICILCSSWNHCSSNSSLYQELGGKDSQNIESADNASECTEACFLLHYESPRQVGDVFHRYTVCLSDTDLHCYPHLVGSLIRFYKTISEYGVSSSSNNSFGPVIDAKTPKHMPDFEFRRFGFSNFFDTWSSGGNISLDCYPFITVCSSGSLGGLDASLHHSVPGWRKLFKLRDSKAKSPKFSLNEGSKTQKFRCATSENFRDTNVINVDINLCGVRIHFHDSSCIVGTISLPIAESSLVFCEDYMDMLCSTEGLSLASPWWNKSVQEFLWGPSLPNLSPILNIRVRKENGQFQISGGIQHVCCILPSEYLAIIIGYFSLSDWVSSTGEQPGATNNDQEKYADNESNLLFKFEIVDSILFLPIEQHDDRFLKIELPQLYLSFIPRCAKDNAVKDVPPELVPARLLAPAYNCVNVSGRDLCLSFLMLVKDECGMMVDWKGDHGNISLISPFSADVWIRLPDYGECCTVNSSVFKCIMSKITSCQLIIDDCYSLDGFETLLVAIDQLCSVEEESKHFISDVPHFLQWRRLKENNTAPDSLLTKIRCCVDSLIIQSSHPKNFSTPSEPVIKADMQFICSATLIGDTLIDLDSSFTCLTLQSAPDSLLLAQCTGSGLASSVLHVCFSVDSLNKIDIRLPSLKIWLYFSNWMEILNLYNSYNIRAAKSAEVRTSPGNSVNDMVVPFENVGPAAVECSLQNSIIPTCDVAYYGKQKPLPFVVKSENIGVIIYFPISIVEAPVGEAGVAEAQKERTPHGTFEGQKSDFVVVSIHSGGTELCMNGGNVTLKSVLEKTTGTMWVWRDKSVTTKPFFQISKVHMLMEILNNQTDLVNITVEVQCDLLDVQLTHHIFCFWNCVSLDIPDSGSSHYSFATIDVRMQLRKASLLISDERWGRGGPLLEIIMRNCLLHSIVTENCVESSVASHLEVNYNNVHKVLWEPFVEPWEFEINMTRKQEVTTILSSSFITDIHLMSTAQLNFNCTESLIECIFRIIEMIKDALNMAEANGCERYKKKSRGLTKFSENPCEDSYAPYILQNLTSLPLAYRVFEGPADDKVSDFSNMKDVKSLQPGASVPIYLYETPEEQLFRYRPSLSSDKLNEKQSNGAFHHFMSIQLDGMPLPSSPLSMDLVGLTCFEVDFSKASKKSTIVEARDVPGYHMDIEEDGRHNTNSGCVFPVVFDVSMQRFCKLIRLYSTVILYNATSMPLELRFDIPFGVSPKILDPIYPDQEFPLPLHLAEAGRMRWRPIGTSYLWSEVHDISNIISQESKIGFLRSFVCYPSHPSSDPFRCCMSVQNFCLPSSSKPRKGSSLHITDSSKQSLDHYNHDHGKAKKRYIHQLTLRTPFIVYNYLPEEVLLTMESGGIINAMLLAQVETPFHHVDPSQDLGLEFKLPGFRPSSLKFPRTETFATMAKFSGRNFSLTEIISFDPDLSNGPIYVTVEKVMNALSGARQVFISVPFLLYNCTGIPLNISESSADMKGSSCTIPSCYDLDEDEYLDRKNDGLGSLSSDQSIYSGGPEIDNRGHSTSDENILQVQQDLNVHSRRVIKKPLILLRSSKTFHQNLNKHALVGEAPFRCLSSESALKDSDPGEGKYREVKACMYSPRSISSTTDPHSLSTATEIMVRVRRCQPEYPMENFPNFSWSGLFPLVPPSGSSTFLVPRSSSSDVYVISATSSALAGQFARRTQVITFQPRYVISNACRKRLYYKQQGTEFVHQLDIGQSSHLHWRDTTRELLVSIRFDEPGWEWSGSFWPDHLGDTQLKMRNDVLGALNMVRVEVQNADVSATEAKIVGSLRGNSGTNLILLSDDDTGYMPYRIDNFSRERLRVYQQQCEKYDTIVHPYSSCPYAWDEPCLPHRLTVEVPGERVLGLYALDHMKDHMPVCLKSTPEKPERTLLLSVHAEESTKVLRIVDSSYHVLEDKKNLPSHLFREKSKHEQRQKNLVGYKEKFSVAIPYISISLINSYPQELLFACAKNVRIDLIQNLDQQKFSFQIASLQVDNQLQNTTYPVVLSFNQGYRHNASILRANDYTANSVIDGGLQVTSESSREPILYLTLARWRKKDISVISFEYISLRLRSFHLELDQEFVLSMLDFFKAVSSRFQSKSLPSSYLTCYPLTTRDNQLWGIDHPEFNKSQIRNALLTSGIPIGAPWQKIYLLARRQKKIYVELFDVAPIKFTLSFSSAPWTLGNGLLSSGESLIHRGLMALADVEGAQIHLKHLKISHQMASWESMQDILVRHYTRQLLHEIYKVFGSAGVIGNPLGFARSLGLGIRDFLSVPARSVLQSPTGIITGVAEGTTSLVSNTVYALSDAATQFSRAAQKGIVAFTFDDQSVAKMEKQPKGVASQSKGVISEVLEGLTGLLQSPIKQAEKHGLPGILSGIALGVTGLVAKPTASILEVTGKTAQGIRNRSKRYQVGSQRCRVRFPRPLSRELPLKPYSLEEAVGTLVLSDADDGLKFKDEVLVMCKSLKQAGKFVVLTERLILTISCRSLVDLWNPEFRGVPVEPEWVVESEIGLDSVFHMDRGEGVVRIVGSSSDAKIMQNRHQSKKGGVVRAKCWNNPTSLPFFHTDLELASEKDAEDFLQMLSSIIKQGKERGWGSGYVVHQSSIR